MTGVSRRGIVTGLGIAAIGAPVFSFFSRTSAGQGVIKEIHDLKPGQFTWHPERSPAGPVAIVVSLPDQRVHVYRNGIRIAVATCSTGKPGHATPTGIFTILEKDKNHHSSTYNNAPMPNMNRLTWSGVALHAGNLPGYPASHGCIRLPLKFSDLLFGVTHVGTPVILAGNANDPTEVVHPGLVLGNYAAEEFKTVQAKLSNRKPSWEPQVIDYSQAAAILISAADRSGTLVVGGEVIGQAAVVIADPGRPLGSNVFVLQDAHDGQQGMQWNGIGYSTSAGIAAPRADDQVLKRLSTDPDTLARVHEIMHPGMVLVTTDLPAHPETRTGRDFVIMNQDTI